MRNVLFLLQIVLLIQKLAYGGADSSDEEIEPRKKKTYNEWSSEMDSQLTELCKKHKSDGQHNFTKVKNEWYNLNPDSNMTVRGLHYRFEKINNRLEDEDNRMEHDKKWDEKKHKDLVDTYLHTYPFNRTCSIHLSDEWQRRHPDSPKYHDSRLSERARKQIKEKKLNCEGESSRRFFGWTSRQDSDLIHINRITLPEGQRRPISMHRILTQLHPDLRKLTADQMKERVEFLQRNPPDEHFPWSEEQNRELLEIYHSTSPEIANQEQRLYDIWTERHPRYNFFTPYYLQVHASTLAHNEAASHSGEKIIAILTNEQKKNLVNMYRQLAKPHKLLYNFHKAWVLENPSLAYITPSNLATRAKRIAGKNDRTNVDLVEGELRSGASSLQTRKYRKYTPREKGKLLDTFYETLPQLHGHSKRVAEKWNKEDKGAKNIKDKSLRRTIRRWMREDLNEKGKEPMITPESGVESGSSPGASNMSQ